MDSRPDPHLMTSEWQATSEAFADRDGYIWFDKGLVPWREAKIHILSHSLHYGGAVFEGARVYSGKVFRQTDHSKRLLRSAEIIGLEHSLTLDDIDNAVNAAVEASNFEDAYVRPLLWRGADKMGVSSRGIHSHFAVAVWEWPPYFDREKLWTGIRLEIADWKRPAPDTAPATAKATGLYIICTIAKNRASNNGYDDALMFDYRGDIAEATGANVFFVKGETIITPPGDCILNGITRATIIEQAEKRGLKVEVRRIAPDEMEGFEQCFLTGTAAEVTPVAEIGPYRFEVGTLTKDFVNLYDDLVHGRAEL